MKKSSETDWERLDSLADEAIDTSDIPPLGDAFFERAELQVPLTTVTVRVDSKTLKWFEAQGESSEDHMSAALKIYAESRKAFAH